MIHFYFILFNSSVCISRENPQQAKIRIRTICSFNVQFKGNLLCSVTVIYKSSLGEICEGKKKERPHKPCARTFPICQIITIIITQHYRAPRVSSRAVVSLVVFR